MANQVHYVADITVKKVIVTPAVEARSGYSSDKVSPEKKQVLSIAHIVTSNSDLEKLVEKTGLHLSLVEDGGDIEKGNTTR